MRKKRDYQVDYSRYSFKAEDDWGDYFDGEYRTGYFSKDGYCWHSYICTDGKFHNMCEHTAKWEFFNGIIPEGLEIDHIIPVERSKESHTKGTNKLDNLRIGTRKNNLNNPITRKNKSEAQKGKHSSPNTEFKKGVPNMILAKQVYQYSLDGQLLRIWPSQSIAAAELGCCTSHISGCCLGKLKTHKGYIWSFNPL